MNETPTPVVQDNDKILKLIAFIFSIVSTVTFAPFLIPLAWMIPMTVISYGIYQGTKKNTVAFGVCLLIFTNLIAGILLLIAKKDD